MILIEHTELVNQKPTVSRKKIRKKKLTKTRETFGFRNVWKVDARIFYSDHADCRCVTENGKIVCCFVWFIFILSIFRNLWVFN